MSWSPVGPAWLFCPADRPERFQKAAAVADMVILDLEDGVNPDDRPAARLALESNLLDPTRTIVRINPADSQDCVLDLASIGRTPYSIIMLAKTESYDQVSSMGERRVIALCETARGVLDSSHIAAATSTVGLMWGAEDLVASLGGRSSRDEHGNYREFAAFARSRVLLAAALHARVAIDTVHLDINDVEGLQREASDAAASGFSATACIHPSQLEVVRDAYRPTSEEMAWATGVIDAAKSSRGVFTFEGRMVDAPLLRHAEAIIRQFGASPR